MRLASFLVTHREPILAEWEAFARTCLPAGGPMDVAALRDHAGGMLDVIAADLAEPQSGREQVEKSWGLTDTPFPSAASAAGDHGAGRAGSGFTFEQMVAEYRALRASVLRLWSQAEGRLERSDIEDVMRFNEAVDQALAESVSTFNQNVDQAKETFLAILGHDLRTPLGVIQTSAVYMAESTALEDTYRTAAGRIARSAQRSARMIDDLLDFTRSRLGGGIPVVLVDTDLGDVLHDVADEIAVVYPSSPIRVTGNTEQTGSWDPARLSQVLSNLIGNAVQHGAAGTEILISMSGTPTDVSIAVHNRGAVIPSDQLDGIFNPMKARGGARTKAVRGPTGSLGLGLYIAERIVNAHGGRIAVDSNEAQGTTFTVHLPRNQVSHLG